MNRKAGIPIIIATIAVVGMTFWQVQTIRDPAIKVSQSEAVTESEQLNRSAPTSNSATSEQHELENKWNEPDSTDVIDPSLKSHDQSPKWSDLDFRLTWGELIPTLIAAKL